MNKIQNIPEGWEVKRLKDCLEIKHGRSQHNVEDADGIYPILASGGEIGRANKFIYDKPSVLIGRKGTIDKPKYFDMPFWTVDTLFYTKIKPSNLAKFFFYKFQAINWKTYNEGSTIPSLSSSTIMSIKVLFPPLSEQKRIAEVLGCWDEGIEELEKVIFLKEQQKKWLMQRLLTGKTRLLGFTQPWKTVELQEVLDYEQPTKYIVEKIDLYDITKIPVLTANKAFILGSTSDIKGIYNGGNCIIFDDFTTDCKYVDFSFKVKSSAIKLLTAKDGNILRFLYEKIQTINYPLGGHKRYWISEYSNISVDIPDLEEQSAIASILSESDNEISQLKQKLNLFKQQKKWLMQQLLTGKKRLAC